MTSMNLLTLPYNCVTISILLEIWFWGPTHPTFLYDVTILDLFFLKSSLNNFFLTFLCLTFNAEGYKIQYKLFSSTETIPSELIRRFPSHLIQKTLFSIFNLGKFLVTIAT